MHFDDLFKYIGYGVASLVLFYLVAKSVRFQVGIVEGLVGRKKDKKAPANVEVVEDELTEDEDEDEES